jgi:AcrR family transcriptional regulator
MPNVPLRSNPRRRGMRATHEAILDAAEAMMARCGPGGLSVSEVSHRAGINRTTAYQHFRTREQLIAAVIGRRSRAVKRMLESEIPLGERIDQMAELCFRWPEIARLMLFHLLSEAGVTEDEAWRSFVESVTALAVSDRARPAIDAEMLAAILLGGTLVWSILARRPQAGATAAREEPARFARELKRVLAFGVLRPEAWPDLVASIRGLRRGEES